MSVFSITRPIVTKTLDKNSVIDVQKAASTVTMTMEERDMLVKHAKWAADAIKDRTKVTTAKLVAALTRLDAVRIEIARANGITTTGFAAWSAALTAEMRTAVHARLVLDKMLLDYKHRQLILDAMYAVNRWEAEQSRVDKKNVGRGSKKGGQRQPINA